MARLPVIIDCDRLDLSNAMFNEHSLAFTVHGESLHFSTVMSIKKLGWQKYEVCGRIVFDRYGTSFPAAKLVCSTKKKDGVLTMNVGDPENKVQIDHFDRLCLRCPKCGAESRLTLSGPAMCGTAYIRECTVCFDTCVYDKQCTWPSRFTVPNLEGRSGQRLGMCDDPRNHR
ncbi:TPA: hypothetical protein DEP96_04205 [Candidatus Uhrbacteria bacterium]|nr:hypothetical protein [Candidatus Uhrbacteria bacterium]